MLNTLQTQAKARLDAQEFFSHASAGAAAKPITVLVETLKDINSEIQRRLGRLGLAVVILTPFCTTSTRGPYPAWDRVELLVSVMENVLINRGATGIGQPASLVAEAVAFFLHGWAPAILKNKLMVDGIRLEPDRDIVLYQVSFFTGGLTAEAPGRI